MVEKFTSSIPPVVARSERASGNQHMTAVDFLDMGVATLSDRGKDYDKPEGERSMGKTVQIFALYTGQRLTEAEGWLFMQILKDVRQWQRPGFHQDSAVDCINYAALKAEAKQYEQDRTLNSLSM